MADHAKKEQRSGALGKNCNDVVSEIAVACPDLKDHKPKHCIRMLELVEIGGWPSGRKSMLFDSSAAVREIDDILQEGKTLRQGQQQLNNTAFNHIVSLYCAAVDRLAPVGSQYIREKDKTRSKYDDTKLYDYPGLRRDVVESLEGILKALRQDHDTGRMKTLQERIRSEVFSDFLEMAEYLIDDEGLKDPAAVLAGGVLEQHLRKLCVKHNITLPPKSTIDPVSNELGKAGVYGGNEKKQILAWAGIRNSAAHAKYHEYTAEQVKLMIQGIRLFMTTYPA